MYLKKLEIHGFKSFAKKIDMHFEPGITSVVGPNGSGKSNIADSLRWVFGEQSMKLLRGKKSEDVIFAGSDQRSRLGGAEVSIFFNNSDHQMPVDYDEVVITRRLYREGHSEYLINGGQVRLLDIQELLGKSGFANTSYCVIGQGMIDQLILGGPTAVKELLEEASGVKPYYLKRERSLRRLERTSANLAQVRALLAEIEPRLRSLRRQARRLERREEIEQELREAQKIYYAQIFRGLDRQVAETSAKIKVFDKQIEELTQEINKLSSDIEIQEKDSTGNNTNLKKLRRDVDALLEDKYRIQENLAVVRGKLKVQAEMTHPSQPMDWRSLRSKFAAAYDSLKELVNNFDPKRAKAVVGSFEEIFEIIKGNQESAKTSDNKSGSEELGRNEKQLALELERLVKAIEKTQKDLEDFATREEEAKSQLFVKERLVRNKQETKAKSAEQKNLLSVEEAKLMTRRESFEAEARAALGDNFRELLSKIEKHVHSSGLQEKIAGLTRQLNQIGGVDELIQKEYQETEHRYEYLTNQANDLDKGIKDLKQAIAELDEAIKKDFQEAFKKISEKFSEYFRGLFNGGRATMSIVREKLQENEGMETDPGIAQKQNKDYSQDFSTFRSEITGIEIKATPPGKKLAGISSLSGGERALTSIALLSAILAAYPSPFVVLDEVDAALDEANSIRFGKILGTLAHQTQFITITHNRETMRQSHTLYGITMGDDGVSKILSLKLDQAAAYSSKN